MPHLASPRDLPPPLEVACLRALWKIGEGTVHDVRCALKADRELAYTTVMTVLDRLEKRGSVSRRKQGRGFIYTPKLTREELQKAAVKDLVDRLFEGDEEELGRFLQTNKDKPA